MKVEIKYKEFYVNFTKEDLEHMASNMQQQLLPHNVSIEQCLDIVSNQFGYSYAQIIEMFEQMDYNHKKYQLIEIWAKQFLDMNFKGWNVSIEEIYEEGIPDEEQVGEVYVNEVFGVHSGVKFDLDLIYEEVWDVLLELLSFENTINPFIAVQEKAKIEKYILQNLSPKDLQATLIKIHDTIEALPENNKQLLLNQIKFKYLQKEIENFVLYQTK